MLIKFATDYSKSLYGGTLDYATTGSAAFDLRADISDTIVIAPLETVRISSGVHIWLNNPNLVLVVAPRSGLGSRGLVLGNTIAVIDSDYQNIIGIVLMNRSATETFTVSPGDRVCQGLVIPVVRPIIEYVDDFDAITTRGLMGFGSSGVK
jgi:dUTP pyrophosphatase